MPTLSTPEQRYDQKNLEAILQRKRTTYLYRKLAHPKPEPPHYREPLFVVPNIQGPALACCGRWQKIEAIPHTCRSCGATYLKGESHASSGSAAQILAEAETLAQRRRC